MRSIQINGQDYPCRVTMGAMVRFKRESGKDVSELRQDDVSDLVLFLWCCVKSAFNADSVAFAYSFEGFADALTPQDMNQFYAGMNDVEKKTAPVK